MSLRSLLPSGRWWIPKRAVLRPTVRKGSDLKKAAVRPLLESLEERTLLSVCAPLGSETVQTDKADYAPEETVQITGSGYGASCDVTVKVTRPDGSVVKGDGTFSPGSDVVTTGDSGSLSYNYQLDGVVGTYTVDVLGSDDNVLASMTFTDGPGSIFTTDVNCQNVNQNLFTSKDDVYLDGGPAGVGGPGLPDGSYFVRVIEPGGTDLGKSTTANVTVSGGVIQGCLQLSSITFTASSGFTQPGYDTTSNPGGEYKVQVSQDADFSGGSVKNDNFKVQQDPPPNVDPTPVTISGLKFQDMNGNGANDSDPGIVGWQVSVNDGSTTTMLTTGAGGSYSFSAGVPGSTTTYTITEVTQAGWTQTFGQGGYTVTVSCPAASSTQQSCTVTSGSATDNDFGNFKNILICGHKYYDANANSSDDDGQSVPGFKIGIDVNGGTFDYFAYTGTSGNYCFGDLDNADGDNDPTTGSDLGPGSYFVNEIVPTGGAQWVQTGGIGGHAVTAGGTGVQSGGTSTGNDFGNVCLGKGGGLTLGFWSNKNGQAILTASDFAALTALNLKNANGTNRDFTSSLSNNTSALKSWLLNATATNMANMLSAQLATMQLNVNHGFSSTSTLLYVPGLYSWVNNLQGSNLLTNINSGPYGPVTNSLGFVSIGTLMSKADEILGSTSPDGAHVGSSSSVRRYEEALKIVLDGANNNLAISVQSTPCAVVY